MIGTNAEAALPVLMECYRDEAKLSRADMASAIASIGLNQPKVALSALVYLLTNSSSIRQVEAAEGLSSFGSKAQAAISALQAVGQSADARLQIAASVALMSIAPETPNALAPLILNLTNRDDNVRRQALRALEKLGTNALAAKAPLLDRAWQEKDPQIRADAVNIVKPLLATEEELLPLIKAGLTNENQPVADAAVQGLIPLAEKSQDRFVELLLLVRNHRFSQVRSLAQSGVYDIMQKRPERLLGSLGDPKSEVYLAALQFLHALAQEVLIIARRELEPSTNYTAYSMRDISDHNKTLLQGGAPLISLRLQDDNPEVRQLATNVLLELAPKAAKQAGVLVVPPYSLYAQ